ncbi:hypothetical protein EDB84DRAFT_1445164 [Lactarius hengduanensis]|nr:hypothetical protein EDB84DRAFT_1445164 [Lactarius hengduanensis]
MDSFLFKISPMKDTVGGGRICSIIPVANIWWSVHLIPKFGAVAPQEWTSNTVLDLANVFFINKIGPNLDDANAQANTTIRGESSMTLLSQCHHQDHIHLGSVGPPSKLFMVLYQWMIDNKGEATNTLAEPQSTLRSMKRTFGIWLYSRMPYNRTLPTKPGHNLLEIFETCKNIHQLPVEDVS